MVFTRRTIVSDLDPATIAKLKHSQLKHHLKQVGLPTHGSKEELAVRLAGDIRHVKVACAGDGFNAVKGASQCCTCTRSPVAGAWGVGESSVVGM